MLPSHLTTRSILGSTLTGLALAILTACGGGGGGGGDSGGSPANWSQQAYVKAANGQANDSFGYGAVAISGDILVIGASAEDSSQTSIINGNTASSDNTANDSGAVYVYVRSGGSWVQQAYLKAPNADANDYFGVSVAISGDTIVVGAKQEGSNQTTITNGSTASSNNSEFRVGAAYVFVRSGGSWVQQAYLKAPNADANDYFGVSVAISGDTIVVGANQEGSNQTTITNGSTASSDNSATDSGAAYVFVRSGGNWSQQAYLKAPNAGAGDYFGSSVAISGDTVVVGATDESSSQTAITNGSTASSDNSAVGSGAAYVFVRSGSSWSQQAYLKAPNAESNDHFGEAVAISGDTIVVGAAYEDSNQTTITNGSTASSDNTGSNAGAVYVFVRSGNTWSQQAYLKAPNLDANHEFGLSLAISGNTIVVGVDNESSNQTTISEGSASFNSSAVSAGAAYVFVRSGGNWSFQTYLKAPNAQALDRFGLGVAIDGTTIAVAAPYEDSNQTTITNGSTASSDNSTSGAGAVYVFTR